MAEYFKKIIKFDKNYNYMLTKIHKETGECKQINIQLNEKLHNKELKLSISGTAKKTLNYHFAVVVPFIQNFYKETQGIEIDKEPAHQFFKVVGGLGEITPEYFTQKKDGYNIKVKFRESYKGKSFKDINADEYWNAFDIVNKFISEYTGQSIPLPNENQIQSINQYIQNQIN